MQRKQTKKTTESLEVVCVRLPPADIVLLEQRADEDRRPVAQYLRNLIHDALHSKKVIR